MSKEDGGPAFPNPEGGFRVYEGVNMMGMSLRDWFAGMALSGKAFSNTGDIDKIAPYIVESAYAIADAALEERNKDA